MAEGAPLLREYGFKRPIEGSNPSLSARQSRLRQGSLSEIFYLKKQTRPDVRRIGFVIAAFDLQTHKPARIKLFLNRFCNQRQVFFTAANSLLPVTVSHHFFQNQVACALIFKLFFQALDFLFRGFCAHRSKMLRGPVQATMLAQPHQDLLRPWIP